MRPRGGRGGNRWRRRSATRRHTGRHGCPASCAGSGSRRRPAAHSDRWSNGRYAGAWRECPNPWGEPDASSNQVLFGDDFAKPAVIRNEFLNEFMQAVLEDIVHIAVFKAV